MKETQLNDFKNSLQVRELIQMAKAEDEALANELFHWSNLTGFKSGQLATKARTILANHLIPRALENLLAAPEEIISDLVEDRSKKSLNSLEEYRSFFNEIITNPNDSVAGHYRNLGWSSGKGNRVKAELMAQNLIESQIIKHGQGRPRELLKPTQQAQELFGL